MLPLGSVLRPLSLSGYTPFALLIQPEGFIILYIIYDSLSSLLFFIFFYNFNSQIYIPSLNISFNFCTHICNYFLDSLLNSEGKITDSKLQSKFLIVSSPCHPLLLPQFLLFYVISKLPTCLLTLTFPPFSFYLPAARMIHLKFKINYFTQITPKVPIVLRAKAKFVVITYQALLPALS